MHRDSKGQTSKVNKKGCTRLCATFGENQDWIT
jgi:hypothetical protein